MSASCEKFLMDCEVLQQIQRYCAPGLSDCGDEARELGEAIQAKFPVERLEINYVGPVIGNHSGPGSSRTPRRRVSFHSRRMVCR